MSASFFSILLRRGPEADQGQPRRIPLACGKIMDHGEVKQDDDER